MTQKIVAIGCMDPRAREHIDNGSAVARLSRAGGWIGGIKQRLPNLLRMHSANLVRINTHSDCGAAKVVHAGLGDVTQVVPEIQDTIIAPFRRRASGMPWSVEEIEDLATEMQREIAVNWLRSNNGVKSLDGLCCSKVKTVGKVEGSKTLLVTPPVYDGRISDLVLSLGLDNPTTYVVTLLNAPLEQIVIDPMLAVNHIKGMNTVAFHAGSIDREAAAAIDRMHRAAIRKEIRLGDTRLLRLD